MTLDLCYRVFVRNVTITLEADMARWARIEAAKADRSLSRWIGDVLQERKSQKDGYEQSRRAFLARSPAFRPDDDAVYPSRDELHER